MEPSKENEDDGDAAVTSEQKNISSSSNLDWQANMESLVRVTLAGLGGSMVGLSQERRLESMRLATGAAAAAAARRKRASPSYLHQHHDPRGSLPLTWSISFMAFGAIIETSRRTSPASWIHQHLLPPADPENSNDDWWSTKLMTQTSNIITIADYTIGGAVAGLAVSFGRNSHLRRRLPTAMFQGGKQFFGFLPGMALGFVAGSFQVATDVGVAYLEERAASEQPPK